MRDHVLSYASVDGKPLSAFRCIQMSKYSVSDFLYVSWSRERLIPELFVLWNLRFLGKWQFHFRKDSRKSQP
jgi:hypothetical protein